jgi:hypothetical protein
LGKSEDFFSKEATLSACKYISSIHQISFIKSIAFLGQNHSIQGILSDLSQQIAR